MTNIGLNFGVLIWVWCPTSSGVHSTQIFRGPKSDQEFTEEGLKFLLDLSYFPEIYLSKLQNVIAELGGFLEI
jgi:hypothetical protein